MKSSVPEPLGSVLKRVMSSSRLNDVFRNRVIYETWAETAGDFADQTRIIGLKRGRLVVACQSQALASELAAFRKGELLAALNEKIGGDKIADIRFVVEGEDAGR